MKFHTRKILQAASICGALAATTPALAGADAMLELLKIMRDNGQITAEQYSALKSSAKADEEQNEELVNKVEESTKSLPVVTMKGKYKLESQDGQHSFQPIGRIFWDTIIADEDGSPDIQEGSELRRARIGFQAQFFKNWQAKMEYDFAGSDADLKDGWIAYGNKLANGDKYSVKVGQHHVPFGFTTISSSKYMSFLRRPLFADGPLSPARQVGIAFRVDGDRYLVHAGAFQPEQDAGESNLGGDDELTYAIRVAGTPYKQDDKHLLHIGGSYMYIDQRDNTYRVRQRAISHLDDRIFNTGTTLTGNVNAYDLEAAAVYGPLYALGEYVQWDLDNAGTGADTLSGWSIEAGWFLTGESMKYKKGQFSGVSPNTPFMNGGLGAWQAVIRYENLDLNDGTTIGGDGDVLSVGLNWTPVKNIRLLATYNKLIDFSRSGNVNDGLEPSALSFRALVYW